MKTYDGMPWYMMVYHRRPLLAMAYYALSYIVYSIVWRTMVYRGLPVSKHHNHGIPWCFTIS